jgi:hypothetical protein
MMPMVMIRLPMMVMGLMSVVMTLMAMIVGVAVVVIVAAHTDSSAPALTGKDTASRPRAPGRPVAEVGHPR